jgi:protein-tyrosine phosphatase
MTDHTITPPRELMRQWREQAPRYRDGGAGREEWLIERAAQWGADQELEATLARVSFLNSQALADRVRAARRPKPQMLTSIALQMLDTIERDARYLPEITETIRRALEALPDD